MKDIKDKTACTRMCRVTGAVSGVLLALVLMVIIGWGPVLSLFLGLMLAVFSGPLLALLLCAGRPDKSGRAAPRQVAASAVVASTVMAGGAGAVVAAPVLGASAGSGNGASSGTPEKPNDPGRASDTTTAKVQDAPTGIAKPEGAGTAETSETGMLQALKSARTGGADDLKTISGVGAGRQLPGSMTGCASGGGSNGATGRVRHGFWWRAAKPGFPAVARNPGQG